MTTPSPIEDPGYAGRVRSYERGIGLILWIGLAATIFWVSL